MNDSYATPKRNVYDFHGFTLSRPQSSQSVALRVARLAPLERAMGAIMASNWLIGLSALSRDAAI